jgi:hypothetical protein
VIEILFLNHTVMDKKSKLAQLGSVWDLVDKKTRTPGEGDG